MRLVPVELPKEPIQPLSFVLATEAAAAFDQFSRSGLDDQLVRQVREAWPNVLRAAHLVPAVDYLQANRVRYVLIEDMESLFRDVDLYLAPSVQGDNLLLTNLTGHPAVAIPVGFTDPRSPTTITLVSDYLDEGVLLSVAKQLQDRYGLGLNRPPGYE
jgi:Asp-tRNA(Asn)/Glu-tRNA(Gln) amidotransferase A subunit family amidase